MKFKGKQVKPTSSVRDGLLVGVIKYEDNKFLIEYKGNDYSINAYDFENRNVLYSLPENDKHLPWTRKIARISELNYDTVAKFWATIRHGKKLRGIIRDNTFIIKKY